VRGVVERGLGKQRGVQTVIAAGSGRSLCRASIAGGSGGSLCRASIARGSGGASPRVSTGLSVRHRDTRLDACPLPPGPIEADVHGAPVVGSARPHAVHEFIA
jgi:hypothetical protein